MEGKKLLHSISLRNLLSYGSAGVPLDLEPLNVLIGPNASGKSNLIEGISLLAAAPRDLLRPLREGGGTAEWIWKGSDATGKASLDTLIEFNDNLIHYHLSFTVTRSRFELVDEFARFQRWSSARDKRLLGSPLIYDYNNGIPQIKTRTASGDSTATAPEMVFTANMQAFDSEQSILAQVKGDVYPELTFLGNTFRKIAFFREWNQGRLAAPRLPQKADLPEDFLLEDCSNLGLVLNDLRHRPSAWRSIIERLRFVYEELEDVTTRIHGGTIQVFFQERNLTNLVPATRLSDGTIHYLCLLVILCHPEPPPLVCIEEPELGLHPDLHPKIADLLVEASKRTQLIVTTHSETLVSKLSDVPESVVVCERDDQGTHLRRMEPEKLRVWLDQYALGELWRMGEIGGNRW